MRYLNITSPDINNGTGFRVTLWVAGCPHHCPGCHNKETWEYNQGLYLDDIREDLFNKLSKPYISGLTLSGGDPLGQSDESLKELYSLLVEIKEKFPEKNIWIYAGETYESAITNPYKKKVLDMCDVMVDGRYIQSQRNTSLAFRGSENQRILDLKN